MLWLCNNIENESIKLNNIVCELDLLDLQKTILKDRFVNLIYKLNKRANKYSIVYHIGHCIITVGSLFVPALLSVQYSNNLGDTNGNYQINIFWATWIISLLVTIFNGMLALYRVDKKYFLLYTVLERLRSEGWQYFSLTGRYSGYSNMYAPTHTNQFVHFCYSIEKISLKLVAEEFFKQADKTPQNTTANTSSITEQSQNNYSVSSQMFIPSPEKNNIKPKKVKEVVNSIIISRKPINSYMEQSKDATSIDIDNTSEYSNVDNNTEISYNKENDVRSDTDIRSDSDYSVVNDNTKNEIILINK